MQLAMMTNDGKIELPEKIIRQFSPKERFIVAVEGNVIILNAIQQPRLSDIAEKVKEEPMPMDEIVKEVHQYRKERRYSKCLR